ncbi:MAG TPA: ATP-binding protein [Polyangiaceae bacterium]
MRFTALVVDDNAALAQNLRELLESIPDFELNCLIASTRRQALQACTGHVSDLLLAILDLRLPDGDGIELAAEVRSLCPFAQIVIVTGNASLESAMAAIGEGAFAYVLKPFKPDDLLQTARRALAQGALLHEREELRQKLERSEQRHREVVEAVPAFVIALDEQSRIVLWNGYLENATGFSRDEMLGTSGTELIGEGGDRKLPLKSGGHRLVRWQRAELTRSAGSAVTYAVGIDVSEEREMLRRTLRVERLAAVGTLATGLAHEVRNPLNSASLQLQVLKRRVSRGVADPSQLLPVVAIVSEEISRLDHLVSDFLSFAQPRPLALVPSDLNGLIGAAAGLVRAEAADLGVAVECELDPGVGSVEVEPERLRQVLLNLARNSLQAMPGGGRVTFRSKAANADGNVCIEVEDTGLGFSDEAPIFDAFYTTKPGGTGLGLAIVHRIVSEHGGSMRAISQPGCTRFSAYLPQLRV